MRLRFMYKLSWISKMFVAKSASRDILSHIAKTFYNLKITTYPKIIPLTQWWRYYLAYASPN